MFSTHSLAVPEETNFCFEIYISNLSDLPDKQIQFYHMEGQYAGIKQKFSISLALSLLEENCGKVTNTGKESDFLRAQKSRI